MDNRHCSNCGSEVFDDARFCPKCGSKIAEQSVDLDGSASDVRREYSSEEDIDYLIDADGNRVGYIAEEDGVEVERFFDENESSDELDEATPESQENRRRGKRFMVMAIAAIAFVLVVIIGVGVPQIQVLGNWYSYDTGKLTTLTLNLDRTFTYSQSEVVEAKADGSWSRSGDTITLKANSATFRSGDSSTTHRNFSAEIAKLSSDGSKLAWGKSVYYRNEADALVAAKG